MGGGISGLLPRGANGAILLATNGDNLAGYLGSVKTENLSKDKLSERQIKSVLKKAQQSTFDGSVDINKEQSLIFDGSKLNLYENGKITKSFEGVSGADNFQTKEYQDVKFKGPIPEGVYILRQNNYQEIALEDDLIGSASAVVSLGGNINSLKKGQWYGGSHAWGRQRVWLEPSIETNTKGRNNFSVHGGKKPGSAGCIDLTSQMNLFGDWFKKNKKDVSLIVKYPNKQ